MEFTQWRCFGDLSAYLPLAGKRSILSVLGWTTRLHRLESLPTTWTTTGPLIQSVMSWGMIWMDTESNPTWILWPCCILSHPYWSCTVLLLLLPLAAASFRLPLNFVPQDVSVLGHNLLILWQVLVLYYTVLNMNLNHSICNERIIVNKIYKGK